MTAETLQTNTDFEDMGFDTESMDFLQELLSEIYTMSEQSAIREYVANGLDATAQAGSEAPVQITTPSGFDQQLSITDHGVGMSPEAVRELFGRYGGSSKRGSADEIGGFGIGSKAGFAVASMIHVASVKDAVRTEMTAARAAGGSKITAFTTTATDQPSGTTVTLPVDPTYDWADAAWSAFCFARGRVSLNGETITDVRGDDPEDFSVIDTHMMLNPYSSSKPLSYGDHHVVMGGPVYRLTENMRQMVTDAASGMRRCALVIELDPKALAVAPNREYIKDNAANRKAFAEVLDRWVADMESRMLGETAWDTWKKIKRTDGPNFAEVVRPASVESHIKAVRDVLGRTERDEHPTLTVALDRGYVYGERRVFGRLNNQGQPVHGVSFRPVTDAHGDKTVYIDTSSDDSLVRSPKVTRWLRDQGDDAAVVLVSDPTEYAVLSRVGLPTMTPEAMRKYKPITDAPSVAPARQVSYSVSTVGTRDRGCRPVEMSGAEIGEAYDAVTFEAHRVGSFNGESAATVFAEHHPGKRIGFVSLTSQQKKAPAIRRIGLEEIDLTGYAEMIRRYDIAALSEHERTMLSAMKHLNVISYMEGTNTLRRKLTRGAENPWMLDLPNHMRDTCRFAEQMCAEHGLALPDDFSAATRLIEQMTDVTWIDQMVERLGQQQADAVIAQVADEPTDDPWGIVKTAMNLMARAGRDDTEDQKTIIAGFLLRCGED